MQETVYSTFPCIYLLNICHAKGGASHGEDGQGAGPVTSSNESGFPVANLSLKLFNLQLNFQYNCLQYYVEFTVVAQYKYLVVVYIYGCL